MTKYQDQSGIREPTVDSQAREQQLLLQIGAVCAILGPLVLAAAFIPHGGLPTDNSTLLE